MNRTYRVIFNHATGVWQCVSELALSKGKSKSFKALSVAVMMAVSGEAVAAIGVSEDQTLSQNVSYDQSIYYAPNAADDITIKIEPNTTLTMNKTGDGGTYLINVGDRGKAKVEADQGTIYSKDGVVIGLHPTAEGVLTLNNQSKLNVDNHLNVGYGTKGKLEIMTNSKATVGKNTTVGFEKDAQAELSIQGDGSSLTTDSLFVGENGKGALIMRDKASLTTKKNAVFGNTNVSTSSATLDNSTLTTGELVIGNNGSAKFDAVNNSAIKVNGLAVIGYGTSTNSVMNLSQSTFDIGTTLGIGRQSAGTLNAKDSNISTGNMIVGVEGAGDLKALNTKITTQGQTQIAKTGTGKLTLEQESVLESKEAIVLGLDAGSVATVSANNSTITSDIGVTIAQNGKAMLALTEGAELTTKHLLLGLQNEANGRLNANSATIETDELTIGIAGQGAVLLDNETTMISRRLVSIGGEGLGNTNAKGELSINNKSQLIAPTILVGGTGSGTLNINKSLVEVGSIERSPIAKNSTVNLTNAFIDIRNPSTPLFEGFTKDNSKITLNEDVFFATENAASIHPDAYLSGQGNFIKADKGVLTISTKSKGWEGSTTATGGVLKLVGDYTMRDDEIFGVDIRSKDDYGQIQITGTADINKGTLKVYATENVQKLDTGKWDNVVTAGTLVGEFKQVTDDHALVDFQADYSDANKVHLKMVKQVSTPNPEPKPEPTPKPEPKPEPKPNDDTRFIKAVKSENNLAALPLATDLENALDDYIAANNMTNSKADSYELMRQLGRDLPSSVTDAQLSHVVTSLQPLLTGSVNRAVLNANRHAVDAIYDNRLDFAPIAQGSDDNQRSLWAKAIGADVSVTGTDGALGYDQRDFGAVVGADTSLGNGKIGFALGYIDTDTDSDTVNHNISTKTSQAIVYGNYQANETTTAYAHIGIARSDIEGERHIAFADQIAKSDYTADTIMAGLGASYMMGETHRHIAPFVRLDYAQVRADGYHETGAGVYNLTVDKQNYTSLRPTVGIKAASAISPRLQLTGNLAVSHESGDKHNIINAGFEGTSLRFTSTDTDIGRTIGTAGVGLNYALSPATTLSLDYQGQWRDNYESHGGVIGIKSVF